MNKKIKGSVPYIQGLDNLGNTCFINSVVQALAQCNILTDFLVNPTVAKFCNDNGDHLWLLDAFVDLLVALRTNVSDNGIYNQFFMSMVHAILANNQPVFRQGEQNDVSEFFQVLINGFVTNLNDYIQVTRPRITGNDYDAQLEEDFQNANFGFNLLNNQFYLDIETRTICQFGHSAAPQEERVMLQLDLSQQTSMDINNCIDQYFHPPMGPPCNCHINANRCNAFRCDGCNGRHVVCRREIYIKYLPDVLVIQMKLFGMDNNYMVIRFIEIILV